MAPDPRTHTDVPARLDRLPWSAFHRLVVVALGITWILDGLEVTLAGSVAAALQTSPRLHLTGEQVGLTGSAYLAGAVLPPLSDRVWQERRPHGPTLRRHEAEVLAFLKARVSVRDRLNNSVPANR